VNNETVDLPNRPERKTKQKFTLLQLQWAADTAKAAGTPDAMVWILLHYMAWKAKSTTFPLSNMLLAKYGVTRYTKYRILATLEKAGLKTQRRNKQALPRAFDRPAVRREDGSDLKKDVVLDTSQIDCADGAKQRERHRRDDRKRQRPALIPRGENRVRRDRGQSRCLLTRPLKPHPAGCAEQVRANLARMERS
jgi:hypothetical protein